MKLILATSFVVVAAVGISTWFSQTTIIALTERQVATRRAAGEASIKRESELVTHAVAKEIAQPLSVTQLEDVRLALVAALRDPRITWIAVRYARNPEKPDEPGALVHALASGGGVAPTAAALAAYDTKLPAPPADDPTAVMSARLDGPDTVYGAKIKFGPTDAGELRMGVTTADLERELAASITESRARAEDSRNRVLLVSLVVLGIGIVLAALQGVQLARPIKLLTAQAERIAGGDLRSRVPENRGDELGTLARTFNMMSNEINALLVEMSQKASLEKEMELARQVQQAMLPPETLDTHGYLKVVGYCMPASSCGGDWWTYRKMSNGRMLLVVGDATGHGIHSAMIAATARGAVEALSAIDERLLTPEQVLRAIDSAIKQVGDHNVLMTAFAALFDSAAGILHYANAGQNFPYVMKLGATRLLEDASIIAASGNPLGDRNIPVEIRRGSVQLRPGDLFVCFTDGLVERANRTGKLFGDRRLRGALAGQSLADDEALPRLRDTLVATVEQYAEGTPADDDITLVLCHYDPPVANRGSIGRGAA